MSASETNQFAQDVLAASEPTTLVSHRSQLVGFLRRKLGCAANAEDVAQEALERALRASREQPIKYPRAFLFRIAANLLVNHALATKRRRATLERAKELLCADLEQQTPEQELAERQQVARMKCLVSELPEQTRRILYMSRCEGISQSQIALQLGISKTAVEKHMRRAMARLAPLRQDAP
ncbi:RNA polymerase sigma factor [Steroidobacter flavus]|uniref:RNA polymerase sigma factor n=1 Tax=Steroidobacter flavus TaxID=1842136 RepID=A0ABV8SR70_9GAMM